MYFRSPRLSRTKLYWVRNRLLKLTDWFLCRKQWCSMPNLGVESRRHPTPSLGVEWSLSLPSLGVGAKHSMPILRAGMGHFMPNSLPHISFYNLCIAITFDHSIGFWCFYISPICSRRANIYRLRNCPNQSYIEQDIVFQSLMSIF